MTVVPWSRGPVTHMIEEGALHCGRAEKEMSQREINEGMALLQNMLMEGNISQETMFQVRDSFQDILQ